MGKTLGQKLVAQKKAGSKRRTLSPKVATQRNAVRRGKKTVIIPPVGNVNPTEHRLILNMKSAGLGFTDIREKRIT